MLIRKGSICRVDFSPGKGSEPAGRRPGLVIQNNMMNDSKLNTVIMVAITATMEFGELAGNVVLRKDEANVVIHHLYKIGTVIDKFGLITQSCRLRRLFGPMMA